MDRAAHDEVDFDLHFDGATTHQQLGLGSIGSGLHARLEATRLEPLGRLLQHLADASEGSITWQAVIRKDQVEIDRQPRHVADEQVDRGAALERERVVDEDERRDLGEQPRRVEVDLVHGLSTNNPSADRETQARSLPVGNWAGSNLAAQGSDSSRPSCRHSRTVLTLVQCCSSSRSTSARRL